ncbi:hypothetical protein LLH06_16410 [Mucilaginibacter daejeonensis]|uniref:hypothetical protein n=1 Tax=Mucilaginibacter daejeonensis TaxID=398049 RepID=UPI001D171481|nr:hypothetical protein [Mucilaginibacter daejeonensis]UEG52541.1 hypothetical protein LLH06_16410 [Mucilaginibacter daejeonensis]
METTEYLIILLEELRIKRSVFDEQIRAVIAAPRDTGIESAHREEFMHFLAQRIIHIERKINDRLNDIKLDLDQIADR